MVRYICNKTFYVNQQDTDGNHRCRRKAALLELRCGIPV